MNHALTGGIIGALLPLPIAIPVAFASHFVLDALPHFGVEHGKEGVSPKWKAVHIIDAIGTLGLGLWALLTHNYTVFVGGFAAISPDFVWIQRYIADRTFNMNHNMHWFTRWHDGIQRWERAWGLAVEIPITLLLLLVTFNVLS